MTEGSNVSEGCINVGVNVALPKTRAIPKVNVKPKVKPKLEFLTPSQDSKRDICENISHVNLVNTKVKAELSKVTEIYSSELKSCNRFEEL